MSIREASTLVGVSSATLRRWCDAGDVEAFTTPGGHRRFARSALMALLPAARRARPNLRNLGETPAQMARVYRRDARRAACGTTWLESLEPCQLEPFRDHGRRIVEDLVRYFDSRSPAGREAALASAEEAAAEYGRIAGRRSVALRDAVEVFLRFRMPLLRELAALARRRDLDAPAATELLETATGAIDRLLVAMMAGHDSAGGAGAAAVELAAERYPGLTGQLVNRPPADLGAAVTAR